jgi:hypothetical protein
VRRKQRTQAQWQQLITEFRASGQSVRAFCSENRLSKSSFYLWRKRTGDLATSSFVAARVKPSVDASTITIDVADVSVRCAATVSAAWLAELVHRLRA